MKQRQSNGDDEKSIHKSNSQKEGNEKGH